MAAWRQQQRRSAASGVVVGSGGTVGMVVDSRWTLVRMVLSSRNSDASVIVVGSRATRVCLELSSIVVGH